MGMTNHTIQIEFINPKRFDFSVDDFTRQRNAIFQSRENEMAQSVASALKRLGYHAINDYGRIIIHIDNLSRMKLIRVHVEALSEESNFTIQYFQIVNGITHNI